MPLNYKDIAEIIKVIDASECEELVVEVDGARLEVRRHGAGGEARAMRSNAGSRSEGRAMAVGGGPDAPRSADAAETVAAPQGDQSAGLSGDRIAIRAPMVGTFFRAPDPQAAPFVEVGDSIQVGEPLGLIEVMKLYTTIKAEAAGRVVEITAENGTLVEHDQVLFIIEPA